MCPLGQVQIGLNNDGTPFCVDSSVAAALDRGSNLPQGTTPSNGIPAAGVNPAAGQQAWWQLLLGSAPGILSGAANIINAGKGNDAPDNVYVMPAQPVPPKQENKQVIWVILLAIVVVVGLITVIVKRSKTA